MSNMIDTYDPYGIDELRISHSSRQLFKSCPRKLEFRKFLSHTGWDDSIAAAVGRALHEGYQEYLVSKNIDRAMFKMMAAYPIDMCANPMWKYSMEECYATLQKLCQSGHLIDYELATIRQPSGVVSSAIEVPASIRLKGFNLKNDGHVFIDRPNYIPVFYDMYIDAIMFGKLTGEYIIVDLKSTKQDLSKSVYRFQFDDQLLPYALVLESILGRNIDTLTFKYLVVYVDIQNPEVKLFEFNKSRHDIQEWARGLLMDVMNIKSMYNMRWFPRNGNSCLSFSRPCTYWDDCQYNDVNTRARLIKMEGKDQEDDNNKRQEMNPWITVDLDLVA